MIGGCACLVCTLPHAVLAFYGLFSAELCSCVTAPPCNSDSNPDFCSQDYQTNQDNIRKTVDMNNVEFEHFFNADHRKVW